MVIWMAGSPPTEPACVTSAATNNMKSCTEVDILKQ